MLPNKCEKMSDEWWVMSYEWWVMSDENWVRKKPYPNRLLAVWIYYHFIWSYYLNLFWLMCQGMSGLVWKYFGPFQNRIIDTKMLYLC